MIQVIGILLVLASIGGTAWWVGTGRPHSKRMISVCLIAVFAGIFLVLQDRAIEVTLTGFGTIKAAREQATMDAEQVAQIRKRVEAQSATVDLVAQQAAESKKLLDELSQKSELADQRLSEVGETLKQASRTVSELQLVTDFTTTVVAAQNDDRRAFDQLRAWADDKSYPFSSRAQQAWETVLNDHAQPFYTSNLSFPWRKGLDPSALSLSDLGGTYKSIPSFLKPALIEYIWKREDILKKNRMQFLIGVIQNDRSLKAVEYAGRFFVGAAELQVKPLATEYMQAWWGNNKEKIE